jgi:hypothetical protein
MEQVPAATATAFPDEIVQTEVVFEVNVTVNDAEEVAVNVWLLSPTVIAEGEVNAIVCDALVTVKVNVYVSEPALLVAVTV